MRRNASAYFGYLWHLYGSLALLARDLGHTVTGSDLNVYPPMSTQLENAGITLMQGYDRSHLQPHPDLVIVGNAMKRGLMPLNTCSMKVCRIFQAHNFWPIMSPRQTRTWRSRNPW